MARLTITCRGFHATPLPTGEIRLEIEAPAAEAFDDQLSLSEIAALMKKDVKSIDRLSRRKKNPLPIHRLDGMRPFGLRYEINLWLHGRPIPNGS